LELKAVWENSDYCIQCTLPIHLPFSKLFAKICGVMPLAIWQATTQLIKFEHLPIYLEFSFILFAKFRLPLMVILKAKNFKKNSFKTFLDLLKRINNK